MSNNLIAELIDKNEIWAMPNNDFGDNHADGDAICIFFRPLANSPLYCFKYHEIWDTNHEGYRDLFHEYYEISVYRRNNWVVLQTDLKPLEALYWLGAYAGKAPIISSIDRVQPRHPYNDNGLVLRNGQ